MEDPDIKLYDDLIDFVLYRFQVDNRNYKIFLLSDPEFEVFNYECDIVKSFYYMITQQNESGFNSYKKYLKMITKEYGEFFYQSEDDSYISAALIHVNKVYNTIAPVYNAIEILNENNSTEKDVTFLHSMLTDNSEYDYLILLRKTRHKSLLNEDLDNNNIYLDVIHEAIHMVEHEKNPSWWKFWIKEHKDSQEIDEISNELYNEWSTGILSLKNY
jgi:hypothetical protein